MKKLMIITTVIIILFVFSVQFVNSPQNARKRPLKLEGDKMEFIEREFDRQIPRQLNDEMIVLVLPAKCAGEEEDKLIENKGKELALDLRDIFFWHSSVMYRFETITSNK